MKLLRPKIVVPMAGLGSRFAEAGYAEIKPLIPIFGKPMIEHVVDSIKLDADWIFIVQPSHRQKYNLDEVLQKIKPGCKVVSTEDGLTEGAACSVLLAKEYINNDLPLIVINSDNIISWDHTIFNNMLLDHESDGLILCFKDTDPKWSFVKLDDSQQRAVAVAEKIPISDNATAGIYIWKRGADFVHAAETMINKNIRTNNEFYICPVYNENINIGHNISVGMVNEMHGVGTPKDLLEYINR